MIYRQLTCSGTSFTLSEYNGANCGGSPWHTNKVDTGCSWFNTSIHNSSLPNSTISNSTYYEITDCGGGSTFPWVWPGLGIGIFCCCCCCIGAYCINKRRNKGGLNTGYVQTYG